MPKPETKQKACPGTVSCGTMRPQDLIPCFLMQLRSLGSKVYNRISDEINAHNLMGDDGITIIEDHPFWTSEECSEILNEDLFNALNEHAPENHYFGSHPGDGADYGFWECEEETTDQTMVKAIKNKIENLIR